MTHKEKCEELRKIRVKIAEELGRPELVRKEPCNYDGPCSGTCPACYQEEKALMDALYSQYNSGGSIMAIDDSFDTDLEAGVFGGIQVSTPRKDNKKEKDGFTSGCGFGEAPKHDVFNEFGPFGNTKYPMPEIDGKMRVDIPPSEPEIRGGMTVSKPTKDTPIPPLPPLPPVVRTEGLIINREAFTEDEEKPKNKPEPPVKEKKGLFGKKPKKK